MKQDDAYDPGLVTNFFQNDYQDRGMLKWQGYYLSDHTKELKKQAAAEAVVNHPQPVMTPEEISQVLANAFSNNHPVSIQLYTVDSNGDLLPNVVGKVAGYFESQIILEPVQEIDLLNIRHIQFI